MLNIRATRINKGLTQIELAEKAEIAQAYLSEIENGKTKPSLTVLERLADALDVSIVELFKDTGKYEKTVGL